MNKTELGANWIEQEEKLKQKFVTVTDNDLTFEEGRKEEMSGVLQVKLVKDKEQLHKIIKTL